MGCGSSKQARPDGNSNELQTTQQQQTHAAPTSAAQTTGAGAAAGGTSTGAVGGAQTGRNEKAVRNKSNPIVYFDMEQEGERNYDSAGVLFLDLELFPTAVK